MRLVTITAIVANQMRDLYDYYRDESFGYAYLDYYCNLTRLSCATLTLSFAYCDEKWQLNEFAADWWNDYYNMFGDWERK